MDYANDAEFMRSYLGGFFDEKQLVLIETAFEGELITNSGTELYYDSPEVRAAVRFTARIKDHGNRLRKIMNNIIEHEGTFVP